MSLGVLLLVAGAAVGVAALAWMIWIGRQRGAMETASGLAVLQPLRWKEFAQLVTRSFEGRGFRIDDVQKNPGVDGVDYTLRRGDERHLLMIKHGGAYRVGPGPVRGVLSMLPAHGAQGGILVTSGRFDAAAVEAGRGQPVTLVDGEALWNQIKPLLPTAMLDEADRRASAARTQALGRARLFALLGVSLALAGGVTLLLGRDVGSGTDDAVAAPLAPPPAAPARAAAAQAPTTAAAPADTPPPARAAAQPVTLSETELEQQRNLAAGEALLVPGVASTRWETRSTLEIAILVDDDDERARIVERVCARLLEREALRYSRVKIVRFGAPANASPRWAQCR